MKKTILNIFLVAMALLFIAIFNSIVFSGARDSDAYFESKGNAVEIKATITGSEKYTEIDEGMERDYWHAKVSYTYGDISYSNVFYDSSSKEPQIGKVVDVKINPDKPETLLPDNLELSLSLFLSPVFLTLITIGLFYLTESIFNYLTKEKFNSTNIPKIVAALFGLSKLAVESIVFHSKQDSFVFGIFSIIALGISALIFIISRKKSKANEEKNQYLNPGNI